MLKLKTLLSIILIMCPLLLQAQDTTSQAQDTTILKTDTLAPTNKITSNLEKGRQVNMPDTSIEKLKKRLKKIKQNARQNKTAIQGLLHGKQIDNKTKYKLMKSNLTKVARTYYLLNRKIIDLKSRTTSKNLDVFITSLNNPESKALGFSFNEKVMDLVKTVILKGKTRKSKRNEKIVSTTESIMSSPIFKSLVVLTPPLAIANSVMTFFHTLSVSDKHIDAETLHEFESKLNKYVSYYTALNQANKKFQNGLSFNNDQLNMLQKNMYNHLLFTASALGFDAPKRKGNEPYGVTLNRYFLTFNKESVEDFFNKLEKKYTKNGEIDYATLLRENMSLKEANNQLEDLESQTQRFENLFNEYFSLLNSYHSGVNKAMDLAISNGLAEKDLVKRKKEEFNGLEKQAIRDMKTSINLEELEKNTEGIKYRYKIF